MYNGPNELSEYLCAGYQGSAPTLSHYLYRPLPLLKLPHAVNYTNSGPAFIAVGSGIAPLTSSCARRSLSLHSIAAVLPSNC